MKKILVPIDFSHNALKAALYAAEIAMRNDAVIYFLHVLETGLKNTSEPVVRELIRSDSVREMEIFQGSVTKVYPELKTRLVLEEGDAIGSILQYSIYKKIDLIIMSTRGAGKIKELLIGTVAAGIVAKSRIPVLVVPEKYQTEKPDGILFATNRFERNKNLLEVITGMAKIFSATIHVLMFIDSDKADAGDYIDDNRRLDHYLRFLAKAYPGVNFKGKVVEATDFEGAVELYHALNETDMAAMITYPKSFWERVLHKSATRKMVYHSKIPVLAIPYSMKNPAKSGIKVSQHS